MGRRSLIFILTVMAIVNMAMADNLLLRLYVDDILQETKTVNSASESFDFNTSPLKPGIHVVTVMADDGSGVLSSPYSRIFYKQSDYELAQDETEQVRLYVDEKLVETKAANGSTCNFEYDASQLSIGLHTVMVQGVGKAGWLSSPYCRVFYLTPPESRYENIRCFYTIDDSEVFIEGGTEENGLCSFGIDASALADGQHTITCILVLDDGVVCDMETTTFDFMSRDIQGIEISYDGRYVAMATADERDIYYTTDGTEPTMESAVYDGNRFDAAGIRTINAAVYDEEGALDGIATYQIPVYFDGDTATVFIAGSLDQAFGWTNEEEVLNLTIAGALNANDSETIANLPAIRFLNLKEAQFSETNAEIANPTALCVTLPSENVQNIVSVDLPSAGAVIWPAAEAINSGLLQLNDNALLYVDNATIAANSGVRNVVANGHAASITLTDVGNFYCPQAFTASVAEYTHAYGMETAVDGGTQGWETIALPFAPAKVEHQGEEIRPFAANVDPAEYKPFWLYALSEAGWVAEAAIAANTPYLISMPNNPQYSPQYNLTGDVVFTAENVTVPVTEQRVATWGDYALVPTMVAMDVDDAIAPINRYEAYDDCVEGSAFVPALRETAPFEAYLTKGSGFFGPMRISQLGDMSGLPLITKATDDELWRVYSRDGVLYVATSVAQRAVLYGINGQAIRVLDLTPGINEVHGLAPSVYLLKDTKVFINP